MCCATGCVQGSDLSKMMLSSNSLSWPEPVNIKLKPRPKNSSVVCEQHGALAEELAHMAEVGVLSQLHDKHMCELCRQPLPSATTVRRSAFWISAPELLKCRVPSFRFEQL